jgi:glycosyltransferase involved in cell wall biosynthesis
MPARPRTLILLAKKRPADLEARIAAGEEPEVEYLALARRLGAEIVDFHTVEASTNRLVRWVTRRLGLGCGLALLGAQRRREFDHLYATGEDVGIPLVMLLRALRWHERLTVVVHNADTPKRRAVLRALGHRAYRAVICLSAEQERVLVEVVGLPAAKVRRMRQWIDHRFYRPASGDDGAAGDYVLSIGMESRDYPTLQAAAARLPYPFRVVASGWSPTAGFAAAGGIAAGGNITVERNLSYARLRALYAGCRMVVVPLRHVTYAAGVTGICETMAMAKPVVVSASPGIVDYVEDGTSGRLVPVGDADAMRQAIAELWDDPESARAMGRRNRGWVEAEINTDAYVEQVAHLLGVTP